MLLDVSAFWHSCHQGVCILSAFIGTGSGFTARMSYCVTNTLLLVPMLGPSDTQAGVMNSLEVSGALAPVKGRDLVS